MPVDIVFADPAGLRAAFRSPIDEPRARALAETVLHNDWLDSFALMAEENDEEDDGEGFDRGDEEEDDDVDQGIEESDEEGAGDDLPGFSGPRIT